MTIRKLAERRLKRFRVMGNYIPLSFRYCGFHTPLRIGCRDMIDYVLQPAGPIFWEWKRSIEG